MNNLAGTKIDHYEIQASLGQGGMGAVYRAYDLNLARPVALKVMHAQLAGQEEFQKRFYQMNYCFLHNYPNLESNELP